MEYATTATRVDLVRSHIDKISQEHHGPIVIMTCGIAGAGKTTLTRSIIQNIPNFERVSIDAIIASRHGLYNIDYPPSKHAEYEDEADDIYQETFLQLLRKGKNVVLDRSFYAKEDRDEFKKFTETEGGRWILVYLKAERNLLWQRICERRRNGINADSALEIDEELLDRYFEGFDIPNGEGEIVIHVE